MGSGTPESKCRVASAILILFVLILFYRERDQRPRPLIENSERRWSSFDSLVKSWPTVEYKNGTDMIWQIPDSPKAVLFIAHECNGRAVSLWDRSSTCEGCVGLPEERLEALSRSVGEERLVVRDIIEWWIAKNKLDKLPVFALGASSGGYFVSALAASLKFSGVVLMIDEGLFEQMDVPGDYTNHVGIFKSSSRPS